MSSLFYRLILSGCCLMFSSLQGQNTPILKKIFGGNTSKSPVWVSKKGPYQPESTKFFDLIHTKLEVSFDWGQRKLLGKASLTLKSHFYDQDTLVLDAKGFDVKNLKVYIRGKEVGSKFVYDQKQIKIKLTDAYSVSDTLSVNIEYIANPENLPKSGSGAITEDKGLYFINHDGADTTKPRQIWTQGETESSSCWFPTIDHPNQKTTEEIFITVDQKYNTLSNGVLRASISNSDGTRTDHWVHDKPHAPYLFMMAIGEFIIYKDFWRGIDVNYLMEKNYAQYANKIFGNTPEMLEFFSDKLGVKYPWDKYSQVVVRDFVSGAMENTSASLFYEGLNVTDRQLLDRNWDGIIAHELFHHWFGDLVTCESWANLPLNESFANYSEYLWFEHKYGKDEADFHRFNELGEYLDESAEKQEPLIRYHYLDKEEMFDNHSYNKGGCTLHMLRNIVGEEAFFKSLKLYLTHNAYKTGEIHKLRLAFEEVTGQDLNWFFDQFFLKPGHLVLGVKQSYEYGKLKLVLAQLQDSLYTPIYKVPVAVEVWHNGKRFEHEIWIDKATQVITLPYASKPDLVVVDSKQILVGEVLHAKSTGEYIYQYWNSKPYLSRYKAAQALVEKSSKDSIAAKALFKCLEDPHHSIRELGIVTLSDNKFINKDSLQKRLEQLAIYDNKPRVRALATKHLKLFNENQMHIINANLKDSAYSVVGGALSAYLKSNANDKAELIENYKSEQILPILISLSEHFIAHKDSSQKGWYDKNIKLLKRREQYHFINEYVKYYKTFGLLNSEKVIGALSFIAKDKSAFIWSKLNAFNQIAAIKNLHDKKEILREIFRLETNQKLKTEYESVIKKIK